MLNYAIQKAKMLLRKTEYGAGAELRAGVQFQKQELEQTDC